jgi:hypothetical protein
MHASIILPQPVYDGLTPAQIDDKLPATMFQIMGNVRIMQELTSSSSEYFEKFTFWKYLLVELEQYNPVAKANSVFSLYKYH